MNEQNYANHPRFVKGYHFLLSALLLIGTICSLVNIWVQMSNGGSLMTAILLVLLFACSIIIFIFLRTFPLKAQDRAIRAEENLRYYILTRKPLDSRITMAQIIALRFAPDDEFVILVDRAINEKLTADEIKKEIKNWRADNHRI